MSNISEEFDKLIEKFKKQNQDDIDLYYDPVRRKMTRLFTKDMQATIKFLDCECTEKQIPYLLEVVDYVADKSQDNDFIEAVYRLAEKYPKVAEEEELVYYTNLSSKLIDENCINDLDNELNRLIEERKKLIEIDYSNNPIIYQMLEILTVDVDMTIKFLKTRCTGEQFAWLSELFEEIIDITQSKKLFNTLHKLLDKYPKETEQSQIKFCLNYAKQFLENIDSKKCPQNRMRSGGHGEQCIKLLEKLGIKYTITKEFPNGVRVGNIYGHKDRNKRENSGQAWFPKEWSKTDISKAANQIASMPANKKISNGIMYGVYKNVEVGVIRFQGQLKEVFPSCNQTLIYGKKRKA